MSENSFEIVINTQDLIDDFNSLQYHLQHVRKLMRQISGIMWQASERAFAKEKDPETGTAWEEWSPDYAMALAKKGKSGNKKLQDIKDLKGNTLAYYDDNEAIVGNKLKYAAIHQLGGEAGRKNKRVKIPARPYIGLDDIAQKKIEEVVNKYLDEAR